MLHFNEQVRVKEEDSIFDGHKGYVVGVIPTEPPRYLISFKTAHGNIVEMPFPEDLLEPTGATISVCL